MAPVEVIHVFSTKYVVIEDTMDIESDEEDVFNTDLVDTNESEQSTPIGTPSFSDENASVYTNGWVSICTTVRRRPPSTDSNSLNQLDRVRRRLFSGDES